MEISTELLVADLAQKLRRGLIDPHGPNLEADIRGAIVLAQSPHDPVTCPVCNNYRPGHATGALDICDCVDKPRPPA